MALAMANKIRYTYLRKSNDDGTQNAKVHISSQFGAPKWHEQRIQLYAVSIAYSLVKLIILAGHNYVCQQKLKLNLIQFKSCLFRSHCPHSVYNQFNNNEQLDTVCTFLHYAMAVALNLRHCHFHIDKQLAIIIRLWTKSTILTFKLVSSKSTVQSAFSGQFHSKTIHNFEECCFGIKLLPAIFSVLLSKSKEIIIWSGRKSKPKSVFLNLVN